MRCPLIRVVLQKINQTKIVNRYVLKLVEVFLIALVVLKSG